MLKTKPLNELLSQSISPNVSSALLFTPSGSLLATGTSPIAPDAKKSRTYAALAANIWSTYDRVATSGAIEDSFAPPLPPAPSQPPTSEQGLKSLTLELTEFNLHVQAVAKQVLLCLIGPNGTASCCSSVYSEEPASGSARGAGGSAGGGGGVGGGGGSLGLLKTQADALGRYLEEELKGFELPEGI